MAQIQLSSQQLNDFAAICDMGLEVLQRVHAELKNLDQTVLRPNELLPIVEKAFGDENLAAEPLMRQGISLNGLMRQIGINATDVVQAVRSGIQRDGNWDSDKFKKWQSVESVFAELLDLDAFRIVAKAIDLSYEYANLYRKGRILTDIRPLFSEDAGTVDGAVVSFTLRIRYDSVDGDHELSIAMDDSDVRELARTCKRALDKARTSQELMSDKLGISTIVTGSDSND